MNEYALNAAAEFQLRGDVARAIEQSNQAAKYEALEYALTRERIQRENAERTIAGLRNVRTNISRSGHADLPGKPVVNALFASLYGEQQGRELLEEISAGVSKGSPRQTRIRNFTITVEHVTADTFRYSLSSPRVHRDELKGIVADAIKSVRAQVSPDAPLPSPEGIITNATEHSVHESHAESRAKSMATATVINPVKTLSSKQSKAVSTPKVARAAKAPAKTKAAAAKEVEPVQQAQPVAEVDPEVTTPAVEPAAPAQSEAAQEPTAAPHWTKWRGDILAMPASTRDAAFADYEKWAAKNPEDAGKYRALDYVIYRIDRSIAAEKAAENVVEKAAVASGGPSEKHWTRQKGGYAALSDTQKEQAQADFQKYAGTDQKKLAIGVEQYSNNRMAAVAKDIAMGTKMLIAKSNIQQGKAVDLSDSLVAHHFLEQAHNGGRGGNDALGRLRTTVDRTEAKSITLQNAYTLTVERNAKDTTVRTTLRALPGKEKELMDKLDIAATASFNKAGRDRNKDHSQTRSTAELGR